MAKKIKIMNKLCPEDISFKFIKSLAMQDEHAILMRNEEYGIQCEKYTINLKLQIINNK